MNQGVRDRSRINRSGSNERSDQRWIREQAIDQEDKLKETWTREQ